MDFASVLTEVAAYLERGGFPFAVVGGLGLAGLGITRATVDLDIVTDASAQPNLVAHLESRGYETLNLSPGFSNHQHSNPAMGRIDVIYVRGETSERIFSGTRPRLEIGGRGYPIPRAEHLAAMKVHAMKNDPRRIFREMADIQQILRIPGIDVDEIREAFEREGLREKFDELERLP